MPQLIITEDAALGIQRCRRFLQNREPQAVRHAAGTISESLALLESNPYAGRPLNDQPELKELVIPFGDSGYVGLYRYEPERDAVYLLAFRHQKEAGY